MFSLSWFKAACEKNPTVILTSSDANLLIEAVEALAAERSLPTPYMANQHYENNEVECCCGFMGESDDYETARKYLRSHILYFERKATNHRQKVKARAEEALKALGLV